MAAEKNNARAEKVAEQAVWTAPDSSATVTYSLPLFHEIDFVVNEGFRKISHGGVEVGGLLFGSLEESGPTIDAFRPIACDHASGPSFLLSDADIERLAAQVTSAASDSELAGLKPVGWFLSRTRSPLHLLERELALFDRFFPEPRMLTVLIKPERFQPTRFSFLLRGPNGLANDDAAQHAIILPLTGRPFPSAGTPMPAIPAPDLPSRRPSKRDEQPDLPDSAQIPLNLGTAPPDLSAIVKETESAKPEAAPESEPDRIEKEDVSAALVPARKPRRKAEPQVSLSLVPSRTRPDLPHPYEQLDRLTRKKPASTTARLFLVLPLAALLGCGLGYWGYLQLPSPIIPVKVRPLSRTILVSWPAEDTRNAVYAAIRVNDATPVLLSPEEKAAGQLELSASPDIKVELIARNWMRDSRGIVRFVRAENVPDRPIP